MQDLELSNTGRSEKKEQTHRSFHERRLVPLVHMMDETTLSEDAVIS
jgi:hypothetical protein